MAHKSSTANIISSTTARLEYIYDALIYLLVLPYPRFYRRNTRDPIVSIIDKADDTGAIITELARWRTSKVLEANYVQVGGAVLFASIIAALSWPAIATTHWSCPALWYAGILFSLMAVVLGAQQLIVISDGFSPTTWNDALEIRRRLVTVDQSGQWQPSRVMLFVLQAPLMCLAYSMLLFLAGLVSFIVSPLALKPAWNDEAKTVVLFLVALAVACMVRYRTSLSVHSLEVT